MSLNWKNNVNINTNKNEKYTAEQIKKFIEARRSKEEFEAAIASRIAPYLRCLADAELNYTQAIPDPEKAMKLSRRISLHADIGKAYLLGRSINRDAIEIAENQGLLMYIFNAILFIGYDENNLIKSATRRLIKTAQGENAKSNFPGIQKGAFPAMLHGSLNDVWVVECGMDALALLCMPNLWADDTFHPSIIISGGAGVSDWIHTPHINTLLKGVDIKIAYKNQIYEATKMQSDAQHHKDWDSLMDAGVKSVSSWRPSFGKNLADMLQIETDAQKVLQ